MHFSTATASDCHSIANQSFPPSPTCQNDNHFLILWVRTIKIIQIVKIQSPILRREGIHPLLTSYTNSHTTTSRPHDQILLSRPT